MLDDVLALEIRSGLRAKTQIIRIAIPTLAGALVGLFLAIADIQPTIPNVALWSGVSGTAAAAMLLFRHRGELSWHHIRYLADWCLVLGAWMAVVWLNV